MGTIVKGQSASYAVYFDAQDNEVLIEDLKDVQGRVVKEAVPAEGGAANPCAAGYHPVVIGGRGICVPD